MRLDVRDGIGCDLVRFFGCGRRDSGGVAHVEEPQAPILREESADIGRASLGHLGLPTYRLPLEGRYVRLAPCEGTPTKSRREVRTDQMTPLRRNVVRVVD